MLCLQDGVLALLASLPARLIVSMASTPSRHFRSRTQLKRGARAHTAAPAAPCPDCAAVARCPQDLTKPEEHRLRRQLSAVVNFARFREGKLDLYLEWQAETEGLLEEQAQLQQANAELVRVRGYQDSDVSAAAGQRRAGEAPLSVRMFRLSGSPVTGCCLWGSVSEVG